MEMYSSVKAANPRIARNARTRKVGMGGVTER
jgi:hypothetical protein